MINDSVWKILCEVCKNKFSRKLTARLFGFLAYKRWAQSKSILHFIGEEIDEKDDVDLKVYLLTMKYLLSIEDEFQNKRVLYYY